MKLEEQLRNDAQSLRELGWFNRAIMMDAGADEIRRLATANKKLREGCEEQKQRIHRLEEALQATTNWIVQLADSGDAGSWDPEVIPEMRAARAALENKEAKP
jgi:hypothetical protein